MEAPQIVLIGLYVYGITRALLKHGESDGEISFPTTLIGTGLSAALLWWGGFWS